MKINLQWASVGCGVTGVVVLAAALGGYGLYEHLRASWDGQAFEEQINRSHHGADPEHWPADPETSDGPR